MADRLVHQQRRRMSVAAIAAVAARRAPSAYEAVVVIGMVTDQVGPSGYPVYPAARQMAREAFERLKAANDNDPPERCED